MLNVLHTEFKKLYKSKIIFVIFIGAFIPSFLVFMQFVFSAPENTNFTWEWMFNSTFVYMNGLGVPIFIFIAGYIFIREYKENTINLLFSYPYSRNKIFIGKFLIMIPIIILTFALSIIITLIFGLFVKHDTLNINVLLDIIGANFRMTILHFALIPTAVIIAVSARNYIALTIFVVSTFLLTSALVGATTKVFLPWGVPYIVAVKFGIIENEFFHELDWKFSFAYTILIVTFILTFILSLFYYKKADVH